MTVAAPTVTVFFGLPYDGGSYFTLDSATKGVLDGATYALAGDPGSELSSYAYDISVRRGRSRELDEIQVGACDVTFHNQSRDLDDTNALSPYVGEVTPGKRITVQVWGQTIFDGTIDDWNLSWDVSGAATASLTAVDALGDLGRGEFDEWTTTDLQTAGPRISAALDRSEVNFGASRSIGTGVSILQDDLVSWGSNVLNYMQLVAKSDAGRLYASRENVLTFKDRHNLVTATVSIAFRDDGAGVDFHGIDTGVGSELLFNRVGVDREGGTLQTVGDSTSQGDFGLRTLNLGGMLMSTDAQCLDMAEWLLGLYKTPETRVQKIVVKTNGLSATDRAAVSRLDVGDVVTINWTPVGVGSPLSQTLAVEGLEHQISIEGLHTVVLSTSKVTQSAVFILDDVLLGQLDGSGVLAF